MSDRAEPEAWLRFAFLDRVVLEVDVPLPLAPVSRTASEGCEPVTVAVGLESSGGGSVCHGGIDSSLVGVKVSGDPGGPSGAPCCP